MMLTLEGTVEKSTLGMGAWALKTEQGTYEIMKNAPEGLLKAGQQVRVTGKVRDDVMSIAMIGPVLEVSGFEVMGS
ncbi:hypothetical protein HPC62_17310 [Thermoleptolyngbya sichuanensis A183]|uniref:Uncharacterized protein n=3 Tax=Oculatellaceae TaxID=2303507 RepID=A0A6M8BMS8_9CYAN|nr:MULTISPECIES: hypothetical protein [Thermoleptolyngbya]QKD85021.1 hypothetical protein HPC62_17310 [Thermoleptolyngbya sichuanensis A183]WOB45950.1 hypothetical protein HNI00_21225 [Thermoleptolyngbya oregonensis NK1-22]HIK40379.1 hypothetical protein [Thermoleptolyngbya sp. M55_K2018_002]